MELKNLVEWIKHSKCEKCGSPNTGIIELNLKYCEPNNSIQARCAECGAWLGNLKYESKEVKS